MSLTPTNHWKLGLFVLGSVAFGVFCLFWFGLRRLERDAVTVYAYFAEEVDGLGEGSPVKYRGVPIGEVTGIQVARDKDFIEVESEIYVDALQQLGLTNPFAGKIPGVDPFIDADLSKLRVQLRTQLLTGQSFVQTVLVDEDAPRLWPAEDQREWATFPSIESAIKGLEVSVEAVLDELPESLAKARETLDTVNNAIVDLRLGEVSQDARALIASVRKRVDTIEDLAVLRQATRAMGSVAGLADDLRQPGGSLNRALDEIATTGRRIKEELETAELGALSGSLQQMGGEVGGAAGDLSDLIVRLRTSVAGLDATLGQLRGLLVVLERDPGSILHGRSPGKDPLRK